MAEIRLPADSLDLPAPRPERGAEVQALLRLERRDAAFVCFRPPSSDLVLVELGREPLTIGRDPGSEIPLRWDASVSRSHAQIEPISSAEWAIRDDGISKNGTYLNGARVHGRARLMNGDTISIGSTALLFRCPSYAERTATVAGPGGIEGELTPAELRVLQALGSPLLAGDPYASPASNAQIAEELVVSVNTVKTHLRALVEKLDVGGVPSAKKRAEIVRRAAAAGLLRERASGRRRPN